MPIATNRNIEVELEIERENGDWEDVTNYLTRCDIELGDTSQVGTENAGVDSLVRTMTFNLHNDQDVGSFHPRQKNSSFNIVNGEYSPLLFPNRKVRLKTKIQSFEKQRGEIIGESEGETVEYKLAKTHILATSLLLVVGESYTWQELGETWEETELKWNSLKSDKSYTWQELDENWEETELKWNSLKSEEIIENYTVNENGEITLDEPVSESLTLIARRYVFISNDTGMLPIFEGLLGDNISSTENATGVEVQCRDLAKRL